MCKHVDFCTLSFIWSSVCVLVCNTVMKKQTFTKICYISPFQQNKINSLSTAPFYCAIKWDSRMSFLSPKLKSGHSSTMTDCLCSGRVVHRDLSLSFFCSVCLGKRKTRHAAFSCHWLLLQLMGGHEETGPILTESGHIPRHMVGSTES